MPGALTQFLISQLADKAKEKLIYDAADRASEASGLQFKGQGWDNTQRNALRHSMWVGGVARALGASPDNPIRTPLAQGIARGLGYANELPTLFKLGNSAQVRDTLHDLNNNAVGLDAAGQAASAEAFRKILIAKAMTGRAGEPRGLTQFSDGALSFDPNTPVSRYPAR